MNIIRIFCNLLIGISKRIQIILFEIKKKNVEKFLNNLFIL